MENLVRTPVSTLKQKARTTLKGNYYRSVSNTITVVGLTIIANDLLSLSGFDPSGDAMQKVGFFAMYIALFLLLGVLDIGYSYFILLQARKMETRVGNLIYPYTHGADRFILAVLIRDSLQLLALAPAIAFYMLIPGALERTSIIILGLLILGTAAAAIVALTLALVPYLLLLDENYELSLWEVIQKSLLLMNGNKLALLKIYLSFAPYLILLIGTMGIGFFWLKPYADTTVAHFVMKVLNLEAAGPEPITPEETFHSTYFS